jgi:hypothetical protein
VKEEGELTPLAMIKAEAMKTELILEERKKKFIIGTNKATNGNKTIPVLIN